MKVNQVSTMANSAIVWGATGQAIVLRPILERAKISTIMLFDNIVKDSPFRDVPIVGDDDSFDVIKDQLEGFGFIVAIGGQLGKARVQISERLLIARLSPISAVHHTSFVADSATLGAGCQVLAMATVCERVTIGRFSILNTKCSLDHECQIGEGVHIMPGATLAGCVVVEDYATIGAGATILPRIRIGSGSIVGAGAVVTRDVKPGHKVVGCPAREM